VLAAERDAAGVRHDLDVEDLLDPGLELERGNRLAARQVDHADAALQLGMPFGDRHAAEDGGLADPRQADEREVAVEGETPREPGNRRNLGPLTGVAIDRLERAQPRVEHQQAVAIPARRVGHRKTAGEHLAARHVEHAAGVVLLGAPAAALVGLGERRDERRAAVAHRDAVEVAAILAGEPADERRPPAGNEAVARVEIGKAGEARVDDPQLRLAVAVGPPGQLVTLDRAGDAR